MAETAAAPWLIHGPYVLDAQGNTVALWDVPGALSPETKFANARAIEAAPVLRKALSAISKAARVYRLAGEHLRRGNVSEQDRDAYHEARVTLDLAVATAFKVLGEEAPRG